jgi:dihydrofolate reductase
MRKIFFQMMVSLDGYFEPPNRKYDWHVIDDDFNRYASEMLASSDGIILGRVTYESFVQYWPNAKDGEASAMNTLPKYVFSRTLEKVEWRNSTLVKGDLVDEVTRLKKQPGRDLALLASNNLTLSMMEHGLIDEYRIMIAPVVLSAGTPLFHGVKERKRLKLVKTATFASGVLSNTYVPA